MAILLPLGSTSDTDTLEEELMTSRSNTPNEHNTEDTKSDSERSLLVIASFSTGLYKPKVYLTSGLTCNVTFSNLFINVC